MGDFIEFLREGTGPAGNTFIACAGQKKTPALWSTGVAAS
jgi:hypothetical protein